MQSNDYVIFDLVEAGSERDKDMEHLTLNGLESMGKGLVGKPFTVWDDGREVIGRVVSYEISNKQLNLKVEISKEEKDLIDRIRSGLKQSLGFKMDVKDLECIHTKEDI